MGTIRHARDWAFPAILGAAWVAGACQPPPQRRPLEMEPIGTAPNVPRTAIDEPGDASVTTPNSGTPSPVRPEATSAGCASGDFESLDEALKQCEVPMPKGAELAPGVKDKLEVRVIATATQVAPGGRLDVTVVLRNKSNDALPLYFSGEPFPRFEVEVLDAKGRRADHPAGKPPPWPKGTSPATREVKAARITLDKGGTARVKIAWEALKTRWAPERAKTWEGRGFPRAPAGPLAPGRYNLRVTLPLLGVSEKSDLDVPKVAVEVTGG